MRNKWLRGAGAVVLAALTSVGTASVNASTNKATVVVYDSFSDVDGYTLSDYQSKWANGFGPGEMAIEDTRTFNNDTLYIEAAPYQTGADLSVFDHLKYLATSTTSFAVPAHGSVTFSAEIDAETPGTEPGHVVHGTYTQSGQPWTATLLEGQQASLSLHMVDFNTGQLFDWIVSGTKAFYLTERLPVEVTGSPNSANHDTMYTQIIEELPITPGPHTYAITYTREPGQSFAEFFLDGRRVGKVGKVGVPLDVQNKHYTGIYPSMGPGEILKDEINSLTMAHGMISLVDPFPFQHPSAPELHVSVPMEERLFGQGALGEFDDFIVTTRTK